MSTKDPAIILRFAILTLLSLSGCQHLDHRRGELVLDGFSDQNYVELNRYLGMPACIRGRVLVDSMMGVFFPLQPSEVEGVIDVGFSRILTGMSYDYAQELRLVDGRSYRVCGTLRDATPFRQCDDNDCRWYKLDDAELR